MALVKRIDKLSAGASVAYDSAVGAENCMMLLADFRGLFVEGDMPPAVPANGGMSWYFKGSVNSPLEVSDGDMTMGMLAYSAVGNCSYGVMVVGSGGDEFGLMMMYLPGEDGEQVIWLLDGVSVRYGDVFSLGWSWDATEMRVYVNGEQVAVKTHSMSWAGMSFSEGWGYSVGSFMYIRSLTIVEYGVWTAPLSAAQLRDPLAVVGDCLLSFRGVDVSATPDPVEGAVLYACVPVSGYLGVGGDYSGCGLAVTPDGSTVSVSTGGGEYDVWYYDPADSAPVRGLEFRCLSPSEGDRELEVTSNVGVFDTVPGNLQVSLEALGGGAVATLYLEAPVYSLEMVNTSITVSPRSFDVSGLGLPELVCKTRGGVEISRRSVPLVFYVGADDGATADAALEDLPYTVSIVGLDGGSTGFYAFTLGSGGISSWGVRGGTTFKARCCYYEAGSGGADYLSAGVILGPEVTVNIGAVVPVALSVNPTSLSIGAAGGSDLVAMDATLRDVVLGTSGAMSVTKDVTYDSGTSSGEGVSDAWCYAGIMRLDKALGKGEVYWSGGRMSFYCNTRGTVAGAARTAHVALTWSPAGVAAISTTFDIVQAENVITKTEVEAGRLVWESFALPTNGVHSESTVDGVTTLIVGEGDVTIPASGGTYIVKAADATVHGTMTASQERLTYSSGAVGYGAIVEPARSVDGTVAPEGTGVLLAERKISSAGTVEYATPSKVAIFESVTYKWVQNGSTPRTVTMEDGYLYRDKNIVESVERTGGEVTYKMTDNESGIVYTEFPVERAPLTDVVPASGGLGWILVPQMELEIYTTAVKDISTYTSGATKSKTISNASRKNEYFYGVPDEIREEVGPKAPGVGETVVSSTDVTWTSPTLGLVMSGKAIIYQAANE